MIISHELLLCIVILYFNLSWLQIIAVPNSKLAKISLLSLPNDCIQLVLSYLTQGDLIKLMLVNRQLLEYSKSRLFRQIHVTSTLPLKIIHKYRNCISIPDVSTEWTIIKPFQFWKLLNLYRFNPNLIWKLSIDHNSFSNNFIQTIIFKRLSPLTKISLKGSTLFNVQLTSLYITDDLIPTFEKPPHLRQLTVASSNTGSTICSTSEILDCESITDIRLVGNPLSIQCKLKNLSQLDKLTLLFDGAPTDTLIGRLIVNTDSVSEFTMIFGSTYYHTRRPNYIQDIDDEFLKYLNFPKLKRLSIFSRDTINDHYKFILPNFNDLLGKMPPLEAIHISLGCELNLAIFSNLSKHYSTLTRFVWIGNMSSEMYPDYELIKDFRFDMIRGILLKPPMELGRVNCNFHECDGNTFETIFKQSMRLIGSSRGNNYSRLNSYNYCKGVVDIELTFINNLVIACEQRFLPKFTNLRYLIINGLHFGIFETFDSKREMVCVYDS